NTDRFTFIVVGRIVGVRPLDDFGAVGGGIAGDVQREAAAATDDFHVTAADIDDLPFIVVRGIVGVRPLNDRRAVGRRGAVDVGGFAGTARHDAEPAARDSRIRRGGPAVGARVLDPKFPRRIGIILRARVDERVIDVGTELAQVRPAVFHAGAQRA